MYLFGKRCFTAIFSFAVNHSNAVTTNSNVTAEHFNAAAVHSNVAVEHFNSAAVHSMEEVVEVDVVYIIVVD